MEGRREAGKEEKNHSQSVGRSRERIKHTGWSKGCSKHPMSNYNNKTTLKKLIVLLREERMTN